MRKSLLKRRAMDIVPEHDIVNTDHSQENVTGEKSKGSDVEVDSSPAASMSKPWESFLSSYPHITLKSGVVIQTLLKTIGNVTGTSPMFCFHHGAGLSGVSFIPLFNAMEHHITETNNHHSAILWTMDARSHGKSSDMDNMSLESLANDFAEAVQLSEWYSPSRELCLIGHSLGGSVVARVAHERLIPTTNKTSLILIDVVEGTALESLPHMLALLQKRPASFKSINQAVQWSIKSNMIKRKESAQISIPSLLAYSSIHDCYVWRTDLENTEPYWTGI